MLEGGICDLNVALGKVDEISIVFDSLELPVFASTARCTCSSGSPPSTRTSATAGRSLRVATLAVVKALEVTVGDIDALVDTRARHQRDCLVLRVLSHRAPIVHKSISCSC